MPDRLALLWGASFFSGALSQLLARISGLPVVVLLLAIGLLGGDAGTGLIEPSLLGRGLEPLVGLLVCLVLFDGGLNLRLAGPTLQRSVLQLVVVRTVLGFTSAALLAHALVGLSWGLALVFAAISLATGPTVVAPMLRDLRLSPFLGRLLEAEGLILEPFAAVLALLLLDLAVGDLGRWQDVVVRLLLRLGSGVLIGGAVGWLLTLVLERLIPAAVIDAEAIAATAIRPPVLDPACPQAPAVTMVPAIPAEASAELIGDTTLPLQVTLGMLFLLFSGCEALLPESGLPAAVSAGVVVGLRLERTATLLDELISQLALLAITVLFPLLAADVSRQDLLVPGLGGVFCVLALTPARWLAMQIAGLGLPLSGSEKLMLSWLAPRGIVTAAVGSLFALRLEEAGVPGAGLLKGLVFLTILLTVGLQGVTAPWLSTRLGLRVPEPEPGGGSQDAIPSGHDL
ncbi:MAG: cation:proton antiporter [Cyanobium sp.]